MTGVRIGDWHQFGDLKGIICEVQCDSDRGGARTVRVTMLCSASGRAIAEQASKINPIKATPKQMQEIEEYIQVITL